MSNNRKDELLGEPHGTANAKLRKQIIFNLAVRCGCDECYRCEKRIETMDDLSIEHKESWQSAPDPRAAFFDPNNIAFSHLRCNIGAGARPTKIFASEPERLRNKKRRWVNRQPKETLRTIRHAQYARTGK